MRLRTDWMILAVRLGSSVTPVLHNSRCACVLWP